MLAATICLPPAGVGGCVPLASAPGILVLALLAIGLLGLVAVAAVMISRYQRGERDVTVLLSRPIQALVSSGVTCLIGVAAMGLLLPPR